MKDIFIDVNTLDFNKPISYYTKIYALSDNALRNRFKRLNVYHKFNFVGKNCSTVKNIRNIENYNLKPKLCEECNKPIDYYKRYNRFCSSSCAAIFCNRVTPREMSDTQKAILSNIAKKEGWGKRLSLFNKEYREKNPNQPVFKICGICQKEFETFPLLSRQRKFCSRKCANSSPNVGGYRHNSGRGKMGWYKGYFCQSSWELAWVIYNLEKNVKFERNKKGFPYVYEGEKHLFYPDFYIPEDDIYIEIKGYSNELTPSKIEQFPHKLKILYKKDIQEILSYTQEKYGNDFIKLYENKINREYNLSC